MEIKKIGLVGHVAAGKDWFDGQTVSTRLWLEQLTKTFPQATVSVVDTYCYKKRMFCVLWQWLKCMCRCSHIVIMLSGNGLRFFLPLLYYSNKVFKRKIFHRVIGGELDSFVRRHPKCLKYMNSLQVNWVQSNSLVRRLEAMGMTNAEYLENFRNITPITLTEKPLSYEKPFRFCTFSRVSEAKGIGLAIEAVAQINREMGEGTALLDVYGPLEDAYSEAFHGLLEQHVDCVQYKGSVPSAQAVDTLKDYYMHLFPTTWSGEGFPGTLIDCYNAGLPTVASDWAYNAEYLREGETGLLYDWQKPELLAQRIRDAIEMAPQVHDMRRACIQEAEKYRCDVVMNKIMERMRQD